MICDEEKGEELRTSARDQGHGLIYDEREGESSDLVEVVEAEALAAAGGEEDDVILERQPWPLGSRDPRHRRYRSRLAARPPSPVLAWCAFARDWVGSDWSSRERRTTSPVGF